MKYTLIHTNILGQVCTQNGDMYQSGSDSQTEFQFETFEEAEKHANSFIEKHPCLQCQITSKEEKSFYKIINNSKAQDESYQKYLSEMEKQKKNSLSLWNVLM